MGHGAPSSLLVLWSAPCAAPVYDSAFSLVVCSDCGSVVFRLVIAWGEGIQAQDPVVGVAVVDQPALQLAVESCRLDLGKAETPDLALASVHAFDIQLLAKGELPGVQAVDFQHCGGLQGCQQGMGRLGHDIRSPE